MTENKKYEKNTLGWLREQQQIKAKKDGFDNVDDWLRWKADPFNILEKKWGKEFMDWVRQNRDKIPKNVLDVRYKHWQIWKIGQKREQKKQNRTGMV
jgi:hypothetical protein